MSRRLSFLFWIGVLLVSVGYGAEQTMAQTPKIYLDVNDTAVAPGAVVPISIFIQNLQDSISGFTISLTLSRPDIMEFVSSRTIQTCYKCSNPACTSVVAYPCTVDVVPKSTVGTLTNNWDYTAARTTGSFDILLTGIVDNNFDRHPLPLLPYTNGILIKVVGTVFCNIPDTLHDRTVFVNADSIGTFFSNPKGELITPFSFTSGSVTIKPTRHGDLNADGIVDVFDILRLISVAFSGGQACPASDADVNCSGQIDVFDVLRLINYTFSNGIPPC